MGPEFAARLCDYRFGGRIGMDRQIVEFLRIGVVVVKFDSAPAMGPLGTSPAFGANATAHDRLR